MDFLATVIVLVGVWAGLVAVVRRNLQQREVARRLRARFIAIANDLVSKAEFPDAHARQLVELSRVPGGWLTRFMVCAFVMRIFGRPLRRGSGPTIEGVPVHLRAKYVEALLAFTLGDTYRCALLGRIVRGVYSWMADALNEIKPDVNAHATRVVVEQIGQVRKKAIPIERELVCA